MADIEALKRKKRDTAERDRVLQALEEVRTLCFCRALRFARSVLPLAICVPRVLDFAPLLSFCQDKRERALRQEQASLVKQEEERSAAASRAQFTNEAFATLNIRTEDGALRHRFEATTTLAEVRSPAHQLTSRLPGSFVVPIHH